MSTAHRRAVRWMSVALCLALAACAAPRRDVAQAVDPTVVTTVMTTRAPEPAPAAPAPLPPTPRITIATGNERETDYRIGMDLAAFVAPDAGFAIDVRATRGSAENMHLLHDDPTVDLAIVQYDVMQAYIDLSAKGDAAARDLIGPLRVVTPLYTQEIYLVVRSDSPLRSIDQIKGRRINVGLRGSGSALTIAALYERMFRTPLPTANVRYLADDRALAALTLDRTVDVVAVVAGQPAKLFADMKPQAREFIRLLKVDERQPETKAAYRAYFPATIRAASYATWLEADVPTLSVMSFLVTSDEHRDPPSDARRKPANPKLADFARSLCRNLDVLKTRGHPKWREVQLGAQVGFRWRYAAASESEFARCADRRPLSASRP